MELTELHKRILAECTEDYVGLWSIVREVHGAAYSMQASLPEGVRRETTQVAGDLLRAGLIEAGNFEPRESGPWPFKPLGLPPDEAIDYIESGWNRLGRAPNIGDVCWFRATPAGENLAKELGLKSS